MSSFFEKATQFLDRLSPGSFVSPPPRSGNGATDTSVPANESPDSKQRAADKNATPPNSKSKRSKKPRCHPMLQSEFSTDITPPDSPSERAMHVAPSETSPPHATASLEQCAASPSSPPCVSAHDQSIIDILQAEDVDVAALRKLCWSGCPPERRAECWSLLTGYYPVKRQTREDVLRRKRTEYTNSVAMHYTPVNWGALIHAEPANGSLGQDPFGGSASTGAEEVSIMKQIRKDVPRTSNGVPVLQCERVHCLLERILFIWAITHPACGYVQGMNDLVLPFLHVFFADRFCSSHRVSQWLSLSQESADELINSLSDEVWMPLEADLFWNLSRLMSLIQKNYTFDQAGTHAMVQKLEDIVQTVDRPLYKHLEKLNVTFPEFAFRWMNCLLLRELSALQSIRLWDTYLSEEEQFTVLHVYFCAALLKKWSPQLVETDDFCVVVQFLQNPPTAGLVDRDLDELTSSAFLLQQLYESAPKHLRPS